MKARICLLLGPMFVLGGVGASQPPAPLAATVAEVPAAVRDTFRLAPFYQKHVDYHGFPIVSSAKVADAALVEARYLIGQMLVDRPDIVQALVKNRIRFAVMAPTEMTTDVPEHSDLKPKAYWDKRARGLGATHARPAVSCGEENLLNLKGDRYPRENILIHEFAHAIHLMGLDAIDPYFDVQLRAVYARALELGLWDKTYAATNRFEYWAEGVQSYFDCNAPGGWEHNEVNTRAKLEHYDPDLFRLIDDVFRHSKFRYVRYDKRKPAE